MTTRVLPQLIRFGREICGDLTQAERREWWLANGLGSYAAGTIAGSLTRRYHGLLIAPLNPPLGRFLVVAKADATLFDGDRVYRFHTNRWSGAVEPHGYVHLESFELDGRMPVWRYALGDRLLEMRLWMEPGAHTTYVAYRVTGGDPEAVPKLQVRLLVNARDHHGSARAWDFSPIIEGSGAAMRVRHPDWFTLHLQARGGGLHATHHWIENFDLPLERERRLPHQDNHLCVGEATLEMAPGKWCGVIASLHADASPDLEQGMRRFQARDEELLTRAQTHAPGLSDTPAWIRQLLLAADSFVFARPLPDLAQGESIIAGYPWFGDWGRDTMISLPGIALITGRHDSARRILETFARFIDQGMLPNVFPGDGARADYNTVDATLWYIEAWRAYVETTRDLAALKQVFPVLQEIIAWHRRGTRYRIGMDAADGLLHAGEPGAQLTWMDVKIGDWVVTPRIGKPVEINALWYNALTVMAEFAQRLDIAADYRTLAEQVRRSFQRFICPDNGALYDVLDSPDGPDASLRPNQIFAVSLTHSPLDAQIQARVVHVCGRELLTSYGLRSLAPAHPAYRATYAGGVWERDGSYHQGPVWTWLLGHYALAEFRVHGDAAAAQARLEPIRDHLFDAGLGTVSEIFDGASPHQPRGAPAQAWSVACVLEAWWTLEHARRRSVAGSGKRLQGVGT